MPLLAQLIIFKSNGQLCSGSIRWKALKSIRSFPTKIEISSFNYIDDSILPLDVLRMESTIEDGNAINSSRNMYAACIDTSIEVTSNTRFYTVSIYDFLQIGTIESLALSPLTELLEFYGHWPMTNTNWTYSESVDWRYMESSIRSSFGSSILITIYNYLDSNNTDKSSIYVSGD